MKRITILFVVASCQYCPGQILDDYISLGLESNLVLRQKHISIRQAEYALSIAEQAFLPAVHVIADYTSGKGGRSISLPMGDLLNPVYRSLNDLTESDSFREINNVSENFFPSNFYDAKLRVSIPLFNADLLANRKIQKHNVILRQTELAIYERELVYKIKTAYYQYLSADAIVKIHEGSLGVVNQTLAATESRVRNGAALAASVSRLMTEKAKVESQIMEAQQKRSSVQRYFNFLINRDLSAPIVVQFTTALVDKHDTIVASSEREELIQLETLSQIRHSELKRSRLHRLPNISAFLDLGTQASNWDYNSDTRYYLAGVKLLMPLFEGSRNNLVIRQAQLELHKTMLEYDNASSRLNRAAKDAEDELKVAYERFDAALTQHTSAQEYYAIIQKGFNSGVNTLVEFVDARNELSTAKINLHLNLFAVLIAKARVEREFCTYSSKP